MENGDVYKLLVSTKSILVFICTPYKDEYNNKYLIFSPNIHTSVKCLKI